jgi:hypothetical protein
MRVDKSSRMMILSKKIRKGELLFVYRNINPKFFRNI